MNCQVCGIAGHNALTPSAMCIEMLRAQRAVLVEAAKHVLWSNLNDAHVANEVVARLTSAVAMAEGPVVDDEPTMRHRPVQIPAMESRAQRGAIAHGGSK